MQTMENCGYCLASRRVTKLYLLIASFMIPWLITYEMPASVWRVCHLLHGLSRNIQIYRNLRCLHPEAIQKRCPYVGHLTLYGAWEFGLLILLFLWNFFLFILWVGLAVKYRSQLGPPTELGIQPLRSQWDNDFASAVKILVSVTWRGRDCCCVGPNMIIGGPGTCVIPYWDNCHLGRNTRQGNLGGKS